MDNSIAIDVIGHAKDCLADGGIFLSLDGCYSENQNFIAQYLLKLIVGSTSDIILIIKILLRVSLVMLKFLYDLTTPGFLTLLP